jgi:hypothetical protein
LFNSSFHFIEDLQSFENRKAKEKPAFDPAHLNPYPEKYDIYYNDNFTLRSRLVRLYNRLKIELLHVSPMPDKVYIGKDGWLFLAGNDLDVCTGKQELTSNELALIKSVLTFRAKQLSKIGCKLYFLIAPSKASVYQENLLFRFNDLAHETWGESINAYLANDTLIHCVNVYSELSTHKTLGELYHKLDNHWNDLGAFIAANKVIIDMQKDFPMLHPLKLSDMTVNKQVSDSGNMQKMLGYLPMFKEIDIHLQPKSTYKASVADKANYVCPPGFPYPWEYEEVLQSADSTRPSLVIISDSFGKNPFPFLAENFYKTVKIFDAWLYRDNFDVVQHEKPKAVLLIVNEPLIRHLITPENLDAMTKDSIR